MNKDSKIEMRKKLVMQIQKLAQKVGHTPTNQEIIEARICSYITIRNYFGGLIEFQKAAGLKPSAPGRRLMVTVTKEECMHELKRIIKKLKRMPSRDDLAIHAKYSPEKFKALVGGIKEIARMNELRRLLGYQLV